MYDILHDLIIDAPAAKIFAAITEPIHLNNWWTKEASGIAQVEQEYRLYFSAEYDWYAEVSICEVEHQFELKMTKADGGLESYSIWIYPNTTGARSLAFSLS